MRRIITVAALGLAGATLTACGSPPEDASKDDFCDAYDKVGEEISAVFMDEKVDEDKVKDALDKLDEVGTPKEIKGEAREGFEITLDELQGVDWGADAEDITDELDEIGDDMSDDDEDATDAFDEKASDLCS